MNAQIDIRALRRQRKVSQSELAEYLGVDRSTVSRIENGHEPSGPVKRLLATWVDKRQAAQGEREESAA